ncbi:MAG: ornithine carbamoyltransferase [Halobacteriales archaeon]|nr:ornithine carbamoyltransferase [Halobacteriales archaeon]
MPPQHYLEVDDLTPADLHAVLETGAELKQALAVNEPHEKLPTATLAMLFEKPSTRTRTSFETAMTQLGGHAIFLGQDDIHLGHGEPIKDVSRVFGRYDDAIMARVFNHETLETMAAYADVPVINGLSDAAHPCQTLADLMTINEHCGGFEDVSAAWIGDGNNVAKSFAIGCAMVGIDLTIATPEGYGLDETVLETTASYEGTITTTTDPEAAAEGADVIYTDVWVSMGDEDERETRLEDLAPYQINEELLANAPEAIVMHCLPANRGEEITDAVLEGDQSVAFDQAENRLHAQKGLLVELLG